MPKKFTIAIDASRLNVDEKTGIEFYSYNIIKNILEIGDANFLLYSPNKLPKEFIQKGNVKNKVLKSGHFWTQGRFAWEIMSHRSPNVTFIPSHVIPFISKGKFVVTIHDLAFKRFPELYSSSEIFYQNFAVKTAVKKAKAIIVPSSTTKEDILKYYKYMPENIYVIPHGIDHNRFNFRADKQTKLPFDIRHPYILFAGRIESKKNIVSLVKAYGLLRQEAKIKHQLVLVGKPGHDYDLIQNEIDKLPPNIKNDIIETGYILDSTYTQILKKADFFVFPSLYEGFGLPVLEAMACGVPVITSHTSSLKEVVGTAGQLIDPTKPFSIAASLSRLISYPEERGMLVKRGLERAKQFNWTKAAQETLAVLEKVADK